jgi:tripartite-type tricarboxylate transporter receptor subunit TctC
MDRRSFVHASLSLTAFGALGASQAHGQTYPTRPITLICPFAAGGAGDALTRVASDHVRSKRNAAAAVEYRVGAGATIGTAQVARAEPDGSTLGLYSISPFLTVPHLQRVPYDVTRDFTYLAAYATIPLALYVPVDSRLTDWASVVKLARDNPRRFRWGTSGVRGAGHIATEAAFRREGAQTTFVPFSGGAEAITAMLGGHIEAIVSADYGPQLSAGRVRLLALAGTEKLPGQPALPTFKELNYPLSAEAIYGLVGPARLSPDVVAWWDSAVRDMMATPEFATLLKTISAHPVHLDGAAFTADVIENHAKFGEALTTLGFRQ